MPIFSISPNFNGRETFAIVQSCKSLGLSYTISKEPIADSIPVGDVPYCEKLLGDDKRAIDFFPEFLKEYRKRSIWFNHNPGIGFVKHATEWKADFKSQVSNISPDFPFYCSEVVDFISEWRYYVVDGDLICSGGYSGEEDPPNLKIKWVGSGAFDFGRMSNGEIALVEAHAPFACGWYGEDHLDYTYWQYYGWLDFLKGNRCRNDYCDRGCSWEI